MFWIGFGVGSGAAFLIIMIGMSVLIWMPMKKDDDAADFRESQREVNKKLFDYWDVANENQKDLIKVLRGIGGKINRRGNP